jgi:hypothetical protein
MAAWACMGAWAACMGALSALDSSPTYPPSLRQPADILKNATMPLLEAAVEWYKGLFGLELSPKDNALVLVGSQEGLAHLLLSAADHGDSILMTDVAYPSYFGAGEKRPRNGELSRVLPT